ncbi:hypothetical protein JRO89_XS02G0230600 [Xanthoceras sorbifolium]|uniref:Uncharacterized protein n=1 Tax=Xanthoceras sorbifolium TaxID=99658 RepID=A0ABQ8IGN2_9ROSI|nr:hypothetical protein JRO89_XS02G0230600 [Xanthoceras sorbifolium]
MINIGYIVLKSSDKITALCAALNLSDDEGQVQRVGGHLKVDGSKKVALCLVGKLLAGRQTNRDAFKVMIPRIWRTNGAIGTVKELDLGASGESVGNFLRIRITIDATKPLKKGLPIQLDNSDEAASPPRERFNRSTRGQDFSRAPKVNEENSRDSVVREPTIVNAMQPPAKVKENVGVSNSTIAGMVVSDMLDPNRSDNVAIIFNSSFAGVQFFNPSPIVHSTAEILSPLIPTIVASSDYEKVVDTHSDSVTHTLRSCMDFDLGLDSSGGPLLADTCSHLANTGPHGVINEVDFTLKSAQNLSLSFVVLQNLIALLARSSKPRVLVGNPLHVKQNSHL